MKLSWKNLCNIKIIKYHSIVHPGGRLGHYTGVPDHKMLQHYVELGNICEYCGLEFIKHEKQKNNYCDKECRKLHTKWKKEWYKRAKQIKRFITPLKPKKQKPLPVQRPRGEKAHNWTGGKYVSYSICHNKIDWYIEVQPNKEGLMEAKCILCGKWTLLKKRGFNRLVNTILGNNEYKYRWDVYCSQECAVKCKQKRADIVYNWKAKHKQHKYSIKFKIQDLLKQKKREDKHKTVVEKKLLSSICVFQRRIGGTYYRTTKVYRDNRKKRDTNKFKQFKRNNPKEYKLKRLYYYAGVRAKQKNLERTIDFNWLKEKCKNNICSVTGKTFDYDSTYHRNPYGPSIDRIDITKGYTPKNCRVVIWAFNRARDHYNDKDVYNMCKALLINNGIV